MMISKRFCSAVLIAAILATTCTAASAHAEGAGDVVAGYMVWPAGNIALQLKGNGLLSMQEGIVLRMTEGSIGPGERKHHTKDVSLDVTTLNVHLTWYNTHVGLKLLVYSPSGVQFGPWSDGADGRFDGEINMDIDNPDGIEKGRWEYYVIYDTGVERTGYVI